MVAWVKGEKRNGLVQEAKEEDASAVGKIESRVESQKSSEEEKKWKLFLDIYETWRGKTGGGEGCLYGWKE
jgi:hypothetical protein